MALAKELAGAANDVPAQLTQLMDPEAPMVGRVSQWVRDAIRAVRRSEPSADAARKLSVVREAARHSYPAPEIERMLAEIERGYTSGTSE